MFNDEEIGMGFNSESGLAVGTALEDFTVAENPTAPGAEAIASITIINTHEELQEHLGMSFEAQGRYGFFSASAKANFSDSTKFNSTSTFVVARCVVGNSLRRGKSFKVALEAKALLDANRFDEFKRAFGDSFIRGLQTGGEFYAVIRITSISTSKQSELGATLQAEANGLAASGDFKIAFTKANSSESTRSEFSATMYQKAGTGIQIAPTATIDEVIQRYKAFPEIARTSASAYEAEVVTYDTLPLPVPTPEEREDFLFALADAREKKLQYIQTRNDLEFALRNPMFFKDLPSPETLNGAIAVYTKLINAVMTHAIKLSRGQITPPQLFDPASLSPPIVEPVLIVLMRAAEMRVRIPGMIGIDAADISYATNKLSSGASVDEVMNGIAHLGVPSGTPPSEPSIDISREVLAFLQLTDIAAPPQLRNSANIRIRSNPRVLPPGGRFRITGQDPPSDTMVERGSEVEIDWGST
ncbi:hypothetical protein [Dactylosporangium maewongense]